MLTVKDKIEQFKRECKSVEYYTKAILVCNEKIEEYDVILTGLSCPNGNNEPKRENARNPYASDKLEPLMIQEEVIRERNDYIRRINDVNRKISMIENPVERQLVVDLFIEKKYYKRVMEDYHYNDPSAMYRAANRIISQNCIKRTLFAQKNVVL
ncbi:hypothetical protein MKC79_19575 [[Clostridium] innocuum]|nr:hypothetical protein [[Clostridium] innocuum]